MQRIATLILILLCSCGPGDKTENYLLKPKDFQEKFAATSDAMLLDVRTRDEVHKEHLKGSVNFDFNAPEFATLIRGLDRSKTYFVYCASGSRSAKAANQMRDMDFEKVYLLDGGMKAWKAEGMPTVVPE